MVRKKQQRYSPYINKGELDNSINIMAGTYPPTAHLKCLKDYDTKPDCINFNKIKNSHVVVTDFIPAAGGTFFSYLVSLDENFTNCYCENSSVNDKYKLYKEWLEKLIVARAKEIIWFDLTKQHGLDYINFYEYLPNADDNIKAISLKSHVQNLFNARYFLKQINNLDIITISFKKSEAIYHSRFNELMSHRRNRNGCEEIFYLYYHNDFIEKTIGITPKITFEFKSFFSIQEMKNVLTEVNEKLKININLDMSIELLNLWCKAQGVVLNE